MLSKRSSAGIALAAAALAALTGCSTTSSAATTDSSGSASASGDWSTATSASSNGGMDALVTAADKEGQLNVITLPPSWANYGKIIAGFEKKYPGITINSANPNGSSADEVAAAKSQKGQSTAPDVFDIGTAVLSQNLDLVAPYKVANWADIPTADKAADGGWYYDYTGLMSIGYDSSVIKTAPKSMKSLLGSAYKGKVAIKGDPTQANEAASAVYLAALENGGSAKDIQPGIDYFGKLKAAGNMLNVLPTQATVNSGETPVVVQWSYNNLAWGAAGGSAGNPNWKTVIPKGTALGSYYNQAINVDAPHPAAARLWEEYIYSPKVQNLYLASGAYPATLAAMEKNGTVDKAVLAKVGDAPKSLVQLSSTEAATAATLLTSTWSSTVR
ncbi:MULTISPECIES: ABC transporter substrate-binding protein [unclassified Curtobacterium]|uniref:ABC transporter substrate-binding protein n=1 Tax=unclassified Curtobacterium TaxID=257496 RepID=UPI000DAAAB89|nr:MULTISPECIES: ABC transporter substrate-binding protein [unclassified Curtobacterium]PZE27232.1 ABC transporter substrate-binding protein [Curtobacterium sp. MCBD17_028]PZE76106.1 ABC transporter substrate-binding protein [Curtobacterium sp. MCBD17_019]